MTPNLKDKVAFAVGTGRCGTKFISEVLKNERHISSVHERNPLNETFHRYCKWNLLEVDDAGFLHTKETEILGDLKTHRFSFEASAHLSLSITQLYEAFEAKFVLFLRSPEEMINSYLKKEIYKQEVIINNTDKAIGNQNLEKFHQFLGRIVPRGDEFISWNKMTQYGKLAWWWQTVNKAIIKQFEKVPKSNQLILKIEDFDYAAYKALGDFLEIDLKLNEKKFNKISNRRPNTFTQIKSNTSWSEHDVNDLKRITGELAMSFGYDILNLTIEELNNSK